MKKYIVITLALLTTGFIMANVQAGPDQEGRLLLADKDHGKGDNAHKKVKNGKDWKNEMGMQEKQMEKTRKDRDDDDNNNADSDGAKDRERERVRDPKQHEMKEGKSEEMRERREERKEIMEEHKSQMEEGEPQKGKKPWWKFWNNKED